MARPILRPSRNVWRIEPAGRAAVLVDGAALYRALRESFINARHSILIVGWDIDSRTRLVGDNGDAEDGFPVRLGEFLSALVQRRPELTVRLLLWDYSVLYAFERELFPQYALNWSTPDQVQLCLDNEAPLGCSQHQKVVVVDDAVAFSGGLDLAIRRWDTSAHAIDNPHRVDPAGVPYGPYHDVQALVDGAAASALAELARTRWCQAKNVTLEAATSNADPWPDSVPPDFTNVQIGISRTEPCSDGPIIREVETLFLDSIDAAERTIYIENQFLTTEAIAERLARRMREKELLETLIIGPKQPDSWIARRTMHNGRIRFRNILEQADVGTRWRMVYPQVESDGKTADTMVHSKVMIVDDRFLRIGSANLNHRSMGADTECDLAIEARNDTERKTILRVRNQLLGEHCGSSAEDVEALLEKTGSLVAVADTLSHNGHSLRAIDDGEPRLGEVAEYIEAVADPDRPLDITTVTTMLGGRLAAMASLVTIAAAVTVLIGLVAAWNYSPLADYADPQSVRGMLMDAAASRFAPVIVLVIFLAGGLIAFPVTVLIAATAATFGPWLGFLYAATGALASALLTYFIGAMLGREVLRNWMGPRLTRIRDRIVRQGVFAIAAIRMVPVAPFTLVNMVAGASGIRLLDYTAGTLLGLLPGLILMSALGVQIARIITSPSALELVLFALCIIAWIGLSFGIQLAIRRFSGQAP
jgi:phospholipase D1/2